MPLALTHKACGHLRARGEGMGSVRTVCLLPIILPGSADDQRSSLPITPLTPLRLNLHTFNIQPPNPQHSWDSYLPQKCLEAHQDDPGACLLPCFSYHYVKAPLFIIEAQADSVVLMGHDWLPRLNRVGDLTPPIRMCVSCHPTHHLAHQPFPTVGAIDTMACVLRSVARLQHSAGAGGRTLPSLYLTVHA